MTSHPDPRDIARNARGSIPADDGPVWYLPGADDEPAGPYHARDLVAWLQTGELPLDTLCWREGMDEWQPLEDIGLFAEAAPQTSPEALHEPLAEVREERSRELRFEPYRESPREVRPEGAPETPPEPRPRAKAPSAGVIVACLALVAVIAAGAALYPLLNRTMQIAEAKKLVDSAQYAEAAHVLAPYITDDRSDPEACYWMAAAAASDYASAAKPPSAMNLLDPGPPQALRAAEQYFKRTLAAGEPWPGQVNELLASLPQKVPQEAPDPLPRHLAIAQLRQTLKLAGNPQLAEELIRAAAAVPFDKRLPQVRQVTQQIVEWNPASAGDVLALTLPASQPIDPGALGDFSFALRLVEVTAQKSPDEAPRLSSALLPLADRRSALGDLAVAESLLAAAERLNPKAQEVDARRLAILTRSVQDADPLGVVAQLDRIVPRIADSQRGKAASLYLDAATRLRETNPAAARATLQKALKLDPSGAASEDRAWVALALGDPSEERIQRCKELLSSAAEKAHRREILVMIVDDVQAILGPLPTAPQAMGIAFVPPSGTPPSTVSEKSKDLLPAAQAAAEELVRDFPETENLGARVLGIVRRLSAAQQHAAVLQLANSAIQKLPATAPRTELQLEVARGQKLAELAKVEGQLKILSITRPNQLQELQDDPKRWQVVQLSADVRSQSFSSEQKEALKQWVREGGILWACSDVVSWFGIDYVATPLNPPLDGCTPGVPAAACPILADCQKVALDLSKPSIHDLSARKVVPLLSAGSAPVWSLVSYGKGWISDVKPVDRTRLDGAQFWLNFCQFCLRKPDASDIDFDAVPPRPTVVTVTTPAELEELVAELDEHWVVWVQLTREEVDSEGIEKLRTWVENGHVLWLDTDLAREFKFPLGTAPAELGRMQVAQVSHPVLKGLSPGTEVECILSSSRLQVVGMMQDLNRDMTSLLGRTASKTRAQVVCAERRTGRGVVVFRPRAFAPNDASGTILENNLREWSLQMASAPQRAATPPGLAPGMPGMPGGSMMPGAGRPGSPPARPKPSTPRKRGR